MHVDEFLFGCGIKSITSLSLGNTLVDFKFENLDIEIEKQKLWERVKQLHFSKMSEQKEINILPLISHSFILCNLNLYR